VSAPDRLAVPLAAGPVVGTLQPPGSKSLTQRWLLLAALADGTSMIENALRSDDVEALTLGLRTLGAGVRWSGPAELEVRGVGGRFPGGGLLDAREGGTPARFLMAAAAMASRSCVLDGSARLRKRPMRDGVDLLGSLGCSIRRRGDGELPLEITPSPVLAGGAITMRRPASSQFVSAVALLAPWMRDGLDLQVEGGVPSDSYVSLTVQCLRRLGVPVTWDPANARLRVPPGPLKSFTVRVEPDASSAAYGWAVAALVPGSRVEVPGLPVDSAQPDMAVRSALLALGAAEAGSSEASGVAHAGPLAGGVLDAHAWPDGSMAMMAVAAVGHEVLRIEGLATLAAKESDRIEAMAVWLMQAGARVQRGTDWIGVQGPLHAAGAVEVHTQRDHRIAMCAAVLGAVRPGVTVLDPGCVRKSWPGFWTDWSRLLGREA
jgi:3-phosphoshikimate 1-carboxyvinyltransferase